MSTIQLPIATGTCIFWAISASTKTNTAWQCLGKSKAFSIYSEECSGDVKGLPRVAQRGDKCRITRAEQPRHSGSFPAAGSSAERPLCKASRCSKQPRLHWTTPELGSPPTKSTSSHLAQALGSLYLELVKPHSACRGTSSEPGRGDNDSSSALPAHSQPFPSLH